MSEGSSQRLGALKVRAPSLTPVTAAAARGPRHHYISIQAVDQRHRDVGMLPVKRHVERSVGQRLNERAAGQVRIRGSGAPTNLSRADGYFEISQRSLSDMHGFRGGVDHQSVSTGLCPLRF
jgi:hypothetical protein